ncbi:hypothetical protein [Cetobacterium sp. ZWU0022]|uniref:hypothetical protein n=1 Tax=Cetobacterium sp. ZWU0022 TaxID=1340502 RepID=UPI0006482DC7|nr:hypothetical protein [Cetobacterium sp. ZWU0022]
MSNPFFNNLSANLNNLESHQKNRMVKIEFQNLDYLDGNFCDNEEVNYFLKEKTAQICQLQANSSLELGKIFCEAVDRLAGDNHYNGLYEKWLLQIGFNKMTALRHRKRYELYTQVKNEHSKKLVSILPVRILSDLVSSNEKEEILAQIEENPEFKVNDLKKLIATKDIVTVIDELDDDKFYFRGIESLKKLDVKKLDFSKAKQLKDELEKILDDVKKILGDI